MAAFDVIPEVPPDAIFGMKARYVEDTAANKVNLTAGVYATNEGTELVLDVVRATERAMAGANLSKTYLKITGDPEFIALSQELILGAPFARQHRARLAGVQTLSGTGALRLLAELLARSFPGIALLKSNPSWGNHRKIFAAAGLAQIDYRYWKPATRGLDLDGMLADLRAAPKGSAVLLHACAHNPTGVDPTERQWASVCRVMQECGHLALFDCAYQGYATGDLDRDAFAVRHFAAQGVPCLIAQSYSKNMGLYGERVGCASVLCAGAAAAKAVKSQLAALIRPMYSNPPRHGACVAKRILGDAAARAAWAVELKGMADRILKMRAELFDRLARRLKTPGDWTHLTSQIGMFCYTGLSPAQCDAMINRHHVYMLRSGRISVAGLNPSNLDHVAQAFNEVCRAQGGGANGPTGPASGQRGPHGRL